MSLSAESAGARSHLLAHHFESLEQQREANSLGMWMFLATELLVFGALFAAYVIYRTLHPIEFEAASQRLNLSIGTINTIVLLSSSLTMALAVHASEIGWRRGQVWFLVGTALLGIVFLLFKAVEYTLDYHEQLVPNIAFHPQAWEQEKLDPRHIQLFFVLYYVMTGLHAVHLVIGISVMLLIAHFAHRGAFPRENYIVVELWGLYWHFVDIVWIFLLPLLYLIGTREHLY